MDHSADIIPAAFVDPEALVLFFDALRAAGYRISTDQYIAAQDVVLALASQGAGAGDAERLRRMLGPIVCTTPKQQAAFGAHFDRWADRLLPARRLIDGAPGERAAARAATPERGLAEELDAIQRWRRWLRSVASPVAVVVAVVLIALYFAFRRRDGTLLVHSSPDRAIVRLVASDSARTTDSTAGQANDSLGITPLRLDRRPGTYTLRLTLPGHRDTTVTVDVVPRTSRDVDVTLRELGTGTIWFRTRPGGARVVLDTKAIGTTPRSAAGGLHSTPVDEGTHRVRLLLPGFRPVERTETVRLGAIDSVDVQLEPARPVKFALTSTPPGATVTLDGDSIGVTPIARRPVDEGMHELRLSLAGFGEAVITHGLTRDTTIDVTLARSVAFRVTSQPTGATVKVDGDSIGVTPARAQVRAGLHEVVVNLDAFEEFHTTALITGADSLHAALIPVRRPRQRIAFSDRGDTIVVGDYRGSVRTWDLRDTSQIGVEPPPSLLSRIPRDTAYGPDSAHAAVPNGETVIVRTSRDGVFADTLEAQTGHVSSVAFSADGRFLASGNAVGGIRVWGMRPQPAHTVDLYAARWTNRLSRLLGRRPTPVGERVNISAGGSRFATTSAATGIHLWDMESGALVETLAPASPEILNDPVTISRDGRRVMRLPAPSNRSERDVNARYWVDVWDVGADGKLMRQRLPHDEEVKLAAMRADGLQIATLDGRGVFRLWENGPSSDSLVARLPPQDTLPPGSWDNVRVLRFSPDGRRLLALHPNGDLDVWRTDSAAGLPTGLIGGHIVSAAFTVDGSHVVASDGKIARVWDVDRGPTSVLDSAQMTTAIDASRVRPLAVTTSQDGSVRLWNLDSLGQAPRVLLPNGNGRTVPDAPARAQFSPDGRWVIASFGETPPAVEIFAVDGATHATSLPHADGVDDAVMSADGNTVVTVSGGIVRTWNTTGITELADLDGHTGEVHGLAFSPDGSRLASAGADGTIRVWETRTFAPLDSLTPSRAAPAKPNELQDVAFSPNGKSLAAVGPTGVVNIYDTPASRWRTIGRATLHAWPIGLALLLLPLPWLLYRSLLRRRATAFVRRRTDEAPLIEHIALRSVEEDVFPERSLLRIASRLRRRVEVTSPQLDVAASVTQTLRHGGVFTPAFLRLKVTPEYLALVDRATLADQQSAFVDELLDRLRDDEVLITRYYFDGDPRICFPADPLGRPVSLGTLTQQYETHRILLFADARSYFNPLTGEAAGWTEVLRRWDVRAFLTPEAPARWGATEDAVARDLPVYHASVAGLAELADETRPATPNAMAAEASGGRYPPTLRRRAGRWIERDPMEPAEIDEMIAQLRAYLGDAGMTWLAACAVYPALTWKLTLNLGHEMRADDGATLLDADRLLRLSRLPWFRQGYMPDWLRLRMLDHLTPEQEVQVRRTLELLLLTAVAGDDSAFDLEVANRHQRTIHALAGPLLRRLRREAAPSDALRDYVFAEFMSGRTRERLAVRVARAVPALGASRATGPTGRPSSGPRETSGRFRGAAMVAAIVYAAMKFASPAVRVVEAAWARIPESPLPVGKIPRTLDPAPTTKRTSIAVTPTPSPRSDSVASAEGVLGPTPDSGGTPFRDLCAIPTQVRVRAGWWVNSVQLSCRATSPRPVVLPRRGGDGGAEEIFQLESGERIVAVSGSYNGEYGDFLFSLQFHTDRRSSPVYGNGGPSKGAKTFRFDVPAGRRFAGLVGASGAAQSSDGNIGDYLISIGVIHVPDTGAVATPDTSSIAAAGRALCAAMNPMLALFPFNGDATADASFAQVTSLLAPDSGALWVYQREHLDGRVLKRGTQWVTTSEGAGLLSREFVAFFNRAALLSDFLFNGQPRPRVQFTATALLPPTVREARLVLDQVATRLDVDSKNALQSFTWPGLTPTPRPNTAGATTAAHSAQVLAGSELGGLRVVAEASGPWALFRVIARGRLSSGPSGTLRTQWSGEPDGLITMDFTFRSPVPILTTPVPQCPGDGIR